MSKGQKPKIHNYLVCGNALKGKGCKKYVSIEYSFLETAILTFCKRLNIEGMKLDENELGQINQNPYDDYIQVYIYNKINDLIKNKIELTEIEHKKLEQSQISLAKIKKTIKIMETSSKSDVVDRRLRLQVQIQGLVNKILIIAYSKKESHNLMRTISTELDKQEMPHNRRINIKRRINELTKANCNLRGCWILFNNNDIHSIMFDINDATKFQLY